MSSSIQDVKAQHEARLLALPGVVSIGVAQDPDGKPALIIGLDRSREGTLAQLPQTLEGYTVRVEIIGPIRAQ